MNNTGVPMDHLPSGITVSQQLGFDPDSFMTLQFDTTSYGYYWDDVDSLVDAIADTYYNLCDYLANADEKLARLHDRTISLQSNRGGWLENRLRRKVLGQALREQHEVDMLMQQLQAYDLENVLFATLDGGYDTTQVDNFIYWVQIDWAHAHDYLELVRVWLDDLVYVIESPDIPDKLYTLSYRDPDPIEEETLDSNTEHHLQDPPRNRLPRISPHFAATLQTALDSDIHAANHKSKLTGYLLDLHPDLRAESMLLQYAFDLGVFEILHETTESTQREARATEALIAGFVDPEIAQQLAAILVEAVDHL